MTRRNRTETQSEIFIYVKLESLQEVLREGGGWVVGAAGKVSIVPPVLCLIELIKMKSNNERV